MKKRRLFSSETLKRFISVHSWLGIVTGLALFIAFYAGALTMYAKPIYEWTNPSLRSASQGPGSADRLVSQITGNAGPKSFAIIIEEGKPLRASYYETSEDSYREHVGILDQNGVLAWLPEPSQLDHFINELHFSLGLPTMPGSVLMGGVSLIYFLALVTGILIHLPQLAVDLYAFRLGKNIKRFWLDAHNLVGVLSLPFHVMFAFTGFIICTIFVMPDILERVIPSSVAVQAYRDQSGHDRFYSEDKDTNKDIAGAVSVGVLLAHAKAEMPGLLPERIDYENYGSSAAIATVHGRAAGTLNDTVSVKMSLVDASINEVETASTQEAAKVLEGGNTRLHYGDYGGEILRALYFMLGLGGAFLFYSGNLLWIESRRRHRQNMQPYVAWRMAQVTLGICLGCCAGIAMALLINRLLPASTAARNTWECGSYGVVFFVFFLWALSHTPGRASYQLTIVTAILYLCLPLVDVVDLISQGALIWRNITSDLLFMNFIFTGLGSLFMWMGLAARRRFQNGQPNSVWSKSFEPAPKNDLTERRSWLDHGYRMGLVFVVLALIGYLFTDLLVTYITWVQRLVFFIAGSGLALLIVTAVIEAFHTKPESTGPEV